MYVFKNLKKSTIYEKNLCLKTVNIKFCEKFVL